MISIVPQSDRSYRIFRSGQDMGCITVSRNPYHNQHFRLKLELAQYDPSMAQKLFLRLRKELGHPLQVMLYSTEGMHDFLIAGGFVRKRRCYEIQVWSSNLTAPVLPSVPLTLAKKGSPEYAACCTLLYEYYSDTHRPVSPLTAAPAAFCANLPDTVLCHMADGKPIHFAFIAREDTGCEIAYVGTTIPSDCHGFAQSLVWELFQECDFLTMECDDCDPAAMEIKSLFCPSEEDPYDTYILD